VKQALVGHPAQISVDALPGREFAGVAEIALRGEDFRGDVECELTVELSSPQETQSLRWGMTTVVRIRVP
jgi:hypothetical protein